MNILHGKKLTGINSIMDFVGVQGGETIISWVKEYDFPAKKEGGVYVAFVAEIKTWLKEHPELKENQRPLIEVFRTRETTGRFGQRLTTIKKYTI